MGIHRNTRQIALTWIPILIVVLGLFMTATRVQASPAPLGPPSPSVTQEPTQEAEDQGGTTPTSSGGVGDVLSSAGSAVSSFITSLNITLVQFRNETIQAGIEIGIYTIFYGVLSAINAPFMATSEIALGVLTAWDYKPFLDISWDIWQVMISVSVPLMVVCFLASVLATFRGVISSYQADADAREAIQDFITGCLFAFFSYFILSQGMRFSNALASWIADLMYKPLGLDGAVGMGLTLTLSSLITAISFTNPLTAPISITLLIFLIFFALITVIFLFVSLCLAAIAKGVILILIFATAPLVGVLGTVRPFRWIWGAWSKIVIPALLLTPANILLITIGMRVIIYTFDDFGRDAIFNLSVSTLIGNLSGVIWSIMVALGMASLLLVINGGVVGFVFAGIKETGSKAWGATKGLFTLASAAIGFGAGAALGLGGAGSVAGSSAALSGGKGASVAGKAAGSGGLGSNLKFMSSFMRSSGIPGLTQMGQGLSAGLDAGGAMAESRNSYPGLPSLPKGGLKDPLPGFDSNKDRIIGKVAGKIPSDRSGSYSPEKMKQFANDTAISQKVRSDLGISLPEYAHAKNLSGDSYEGIAEQIAADDIASQCNLPSTMPAPNARAYWDTGKVSAGDFDRSLAMYRSYGEPMDAGKLATTSRTMFRLRTELGETPSQIMRSRDSDGKQFRSMDQFLTSRNRDLKQYTGRSEI